MKILGAWRLARTLAAPEWRSLCAACALQIATRLLIPLLPLDRIASLTAGKPGRARRSLPSPRLEELVRVSTRITSGTCLTESFALRALLAHRGIDVPVVIGVSGVDASGTRGARFRAHAWTGPEGPAGFVPVWSSNRREDRR